MSLVRAAAIALTDLDAILQGATYYRVLELEDENGDPVDLTSWVGSGKGARCQMRDSNNGGTVVATPTLTILAPYTDGKIGFLLTSTVTTAMGAVTEGVFDLELYDSNVSPPLVERPVEGTWALRAEVTR